MATMAARLNQTIAEKVTFRDDGAVARFFTGLAMTKPGPVQASKWRPHSAEDTARPAALWAGVAVKK
jgi:S-adenosyl methyltransferase